MSTNELRSGGRSIALPHLDAQADRHEERRRADVEWHLEVARRVAVAALRVVRDEARNEWERLGYASAALETIAGHRRAAA
jgi:hypothetical protein